MTATVLPSAAPPYAVKVWADHINVYAEVPSLNQPCVMAFPLSESGLSRLLQLLGAKLADDSSGQPYLRPPVVARQLMVEGLDQRDLDQARTVLEQLGIIK